MLDDPPPAGTGRERSPSRQGVAAETALSHRPPRLQSALERLPFHEWTLPDGALWAQFYRTDTGYLLRFPGLADFAVASTGLDVAAWPAPGIVGQTVEHLYLNQVLPLALSMQGRLVFHASAVEIGNVAIAFMGESGKGKSTLAASFATHGYRFLTDDGLIVEAEDDGHRIVPSHPSLRLWQDSEGALIAPGTPVAPALDFTEKSRFLAGDRIAFCDVPRRLRRVYFLDSSAPAVTFLRLPPAEALLGLIRHSFLLDIEARDRLASHFDELSELANQPIFYRLGYPRRYDALPSVRRAIVEHTLQAPPPT